MTEIFAILDEIIFGDKEKSLLNSTDMTTMTKDGHYDITLPSLRQTRHLQYGLLLLISMFLRLLISFQIQKNHLRV